MTLIAIPRESMFSKAAEDGYFNEEAAMKSYELVMKMDEEEARVFTREVVANVLWETIEKNHRTVQGHLDRVVFKRIERFKKGLDRTIVSKRMNDEYLDEEVAMATAGALVLIEKATRQKNPYDYGYQYDENDFRRNSKGQFTTKIQTGGLNKPLPKRQATTLGIPQGDRTSAGSQKTIANLSGNKKAEFQSQYMQIANVLGSFSDDDTATLMIRNKNGGPVQRTYAKANAKNIEQNWNPNTEDVVGVSVTPRELNVGGASFNLVGALGGSPEASRRASHTMGAVDNNFDDFSNDWLAADNKDAYASNARTYERLRTGSEFLGQVAPMSNKAQMAASFGDFVGRHGPEAEKVIGPHARKTAYRYRGVSKSPDSDIKREYSRLLLSDQKLSGRQTELIRTEQNKMLKRATLLETKRRNPSASNEDIKQLANGVRVPEKVRANAMEQGRLKAMAGVNQKVSDETKSIARNKVADLLRTRKNAPKGNLYQLQLSSGHLPPSEGVIIDKKGEIAVQAVGYADDHYLPFNMKQLGALKGGEYVRTRSVGGLTSEDIYTGLMSGAKSVTVASRSGTFTMEFEDDFKGTRRYNDKAKRMVGRYQHLLDAVDSGTVSRGEQVPREIRNRIYADVAASSEFKWGSPDPKDLRKAQHEAVEAYAKTPEITPADEDYIEVKTKAFIDANPDVDPGQMEQSFRNQLKADKEVNFQLNARGYEAAIDSLREQFPYYIKNTRVSYRRDDADMGTSAKDQGYVKPRYNRPAAAKAGWHESTITGEGKFSADQADYQNHGVKEGLKRGGFKAVPKTEESNLDTSGSAEEGEAKAGVKPKQAETPRQRAKKMKAKGDLADITEEVYTKIWGASNPETRAKTFKDVGTPEELVAEVRNKGMESPRLKDLINQVESKDNMGKVWGTGVPGEASLLGEGGMALHVKFKDALGFLGSDPFDSKKPFEWGEHPSSFPDSPAYDATEAEPEQVLGEMRKRSQPSVAGNSKATADMTENELETEIIVMSRAAAMVKEANGLVEDMPENKKKAAFNEFVSTATSLNGKPALGIAINNPEQFAQIAENVQRMRTLRRVMGRNNLEAPKDPIGTAAMKAVANSAPQGFTAKPVDADMADEIKRIDEVLDLNIVEARKQMNLEAVNFLQEMKHNLKEETETTLPESRDELEIMLDGIGWEKAKKYKEQIFAGHKSSPPKPAKIPSGVTDLTAKRKKQNGL